MYRGENFSSVTCRTDFVDGRPWNHFGTAASDGLQEQTTVKAADRAVSV